MASMKRRSRTLITIAMGMALASAPYAATRGEEPEPLTWYTVEIIVFENASEMGRQAETWPADPGLPRLADALELTADGMTLEDLARVAPEEGRPPAEGGDAGTETAPDATPAVTLPRAFRRLPPEEFRLNGAWQSLERSSAYRPLLHVAWIQPGFPAEQARLVHLRNDNAALGAVSAGVGANPGAEPTAAVGIASPYAGNAPTLAPRIVIARDPSRPALDGTLRVHRARYLHVQADLLYYRPSDGGVPAPPAPSDRPPDSPDAAFIEQLLAEEQAAPRLFRMTQSRRMRSKELHFLDHPLFGVLVAAWPLALPEPPPVPEPPAESEPPPESETAPPPSAAPGTSG